MEATNSQDTNFLTVKRTVYALILLSIIAFLTGFLQNTEFGFIIYVFYFTLLLGGVKLIVMTLKSKTPRVLKAFLLLTGFSSTLYFLFFVIAVIGSFLSSTGVIEILTELEGIFYLGSLAFLIGAIGSIVLFKRVNKQWQN